MTDGNLRTLFHKHLPEAHWQSIETWGTGQGVPDTEYCFPNGLCGWIEFKLTSGWTVNFKDRAHQIAWLERRARAGGRCFVAVRRKVPAGPRRGLATDELWLFPGIAARDLAQNGLKTLPALGVWPDGPARWPWDKVKLALIS
jgi:hypothetical protein